MAISQTDLLITKIRAMGLTLLSQSIEQARKYYENKPYPAYGNWPRNDKNEPMFPKVVTALPRIIVNKSATFLMKQSPTFHVVGVDGESIPTASDYLRRVIDDNELDFKATAKTAGVEGGIWYKFRWDSNSPQPWRINVHSVEEIIPEYDPRDMTTLIGVRVQYRYMRSDGSAYWYREDWTADTYIVYREIPANVFDDAQIMERWRQGAMINAANASPWVPARQEVNRFGLVPFQHIKNVTDALQPMGAGDYWNLYDLFDRINVAYDSMDKSNQFGALPVLAFFEADSVPKKLAPGDVLSINGPNSKAQQFEHNGGMRSHMTNYADKLESMVYSASGIVNPKLEDVAGLGQLSYAALQLLHGPLIETTDSKRTYWGKWGLSKFFAKLLQAGANMGKHLPAQASVTCDWPDYFPLGGVDKQIELGNIKMAVDMGMPAEDGARWLAKIIGVSDSEMDEFLGRVEEELTLRAEINKVLALMSAQPPTQLSAPQETEQGPGGNTKPNLQTQATDGGTKGAARKQ